MEGMEGWVGAVAFSGGLGTIRYLAVLSPLARSFSTTLTSMTACVIHCP